MIHGSWEMVSPEVWVTDSGYRGPNVAIMGGVHGDEGTGPLVVRHLLETPPHIEEGSLTLMLGNPLASALGLHYVDTNLNRCFTDKPDPKIQGYEAERAEILKPHLTTASALLDVHDTSSECDPFLICERNALDTALRLGQNTGTTGMPIAFGFSEMEPGGSDDFMLRQGKEGICFESGDMSDPEKNLPLALKVAARFLIVQGLVEGEAPLPKENPLLVEVYRSLMCTEDFEWEELFYNFQGLEENQLLAKANGEEIRAAKGDVMFFPAREIVPGNEAFAIARTVAA